MRLHRHLLVLLPLLCLVSCPGEPARDPSQTALALDRAAAHFDAQAYGEARAALAPLLARKDATVDELLRGAAVEYSDNQLEAAKALLERARALDANAPGVLYLSGQLARDDGDYASARPFFEAVHRAMPSDLPTRLALAECLRELGDSAGAEAQYRAVIDVGIENATLWYVAAVYRMMRLCTEEGRDQDLARYTQLWRDLEKLGAKAPDAAVMARGNLARVRPATPQAPATRAAVVLPRYQAQAGWLLPEFASARVLEADLLDDDLMLDLWALTPSELVAAFRQEAGGYRVVTVANGPWAKALCFDVDKDDDLDFLVERSGERVLFLQKDGAFAQADIPLPTLSASCSDWLAVDYDHEGDLDLVLCGNFGVRLWRNDGAGLPPKDGKQGQFTDASAESQLPSAGNFDWVQSEDLDGDNDVDLIFGGKQGALLADSLRAGRFANQSARIPDAARLLQLEPLIADLDGDGRTDLWLGGDWLRQDAQQRFALVPATTTQRSVPSLCRALDLDLDGTLDVAAPHPEGGLLVWMSVATPQQLVGRAPGTEGETWLSSAAGDLDNRQRNDWVVSSAQGLRRYSHEGPVGRCKPVSLKGLRDNARAVGAIVEYRAGGIYRRIYWRGQPQLLGVGERERIDILRVTWPNGASSHSLDQDLSRERNVDDPEAAFSNILQPPAQIGSCPFLYTWNGERYVFVSDVLGITPLGLPIAPGMLVPPDHDEYVLIRAEELATKDGFYELQFTEELREVTYLDHAKLLVVDHPQGTEIYPNERFTFPPFPEAHTHTVRDPLLPVRASGSDGKDWTASVQRIDDAHAVPFELQPLQFAGLCKPWFVELEFDAKAVSQAQQLRLFMTGWFFWSDSSANMASARAPGIAFVPPLIEVPDGQGGWKPIGPPVGFPAGKTKTMVIDISQHLNRADPRLRVASTLRLYWDALRLAIDNDDAALLTRELVVHDSKLWLRGFSAPLSGASGMGDPNSDVPERFDWDVLADSPRWNQHPGMYTRYGEVTPLLKGVDDQFVILGSGDALHLRFDARNLPPVAAGMRRDFLLYLDGWAKDRDPNTIEALEVEPLPFHGMSGYPYRADESYPTTPEHQRYRAEWNTRPALRWIRPLAPAEERRWLDGL